MSEIRWLPLRSDPQVMNLLLKNLGVSEKYKISDILCFDKEYLSSFSSPVLGVILLFPVPEDYVKTCADEGVKDCKLSNDVDPDVFFMNQTIKNACGTVAIIHVIANNMENVKFVGKSAVKSFIEKTRYMSPKEKAQELEKSDQIKNIVEATVFPEQDDATTASSYVEDVSTAISVRDEASCHHYIALVNVNSNLYELDGYKNSPVHHGATSIDSFLIDAARVCQEYIKRDPGKLNFSALVLAKDE